MNQKHSLTKILALISTTCAVLTLLLNISNKVSSLNKNAAPARQAVYAQSDPDTASEDEQSDPVLEETDSYVFVNTIDGKVVLINKEDAQLW